MAKAKMSEELYNSLSNWEKNYYPKIYSNEIKFGDYIIMFRKPSIDTSFCFGFDEVGDPDSIQESCDRASYASSNANYLINYNLRDLRDCKKEYEENDLYVFPSQSGIQGFIVIQKAIDRGYYDADKAVYKLNASDKERLLKIVDEEIAKFTKRLNTYVKKYGTSCVRTWTFSVND